MGSPWLRNSADAAWYQERYLNVPPHYDGAYGRIFARKDRCLRGASYPPGLNPHLTKSGLNDALRLCEMLCR